VKGFKSGFMFQGVIKGVQMLHRGADVRLLVNGFLTDSFAICGGLKQGCSSPFLLQDQLTMQSLRCIVVLEYLVSLLDWMCLKAVF